MISLCVKLIIYLLYFFPGFFCLSVFSYGLLSFLKTTILNSLLGKSQISIFGGGQLLENYCVPLVVSLFPWFFMFLEGLCCCLHIWRSSHILQSLPTGFRWQILSVICASDSETFSDLFCKYAYSTLLVPWCGRGGVIIKIVCLPSILQSQAGCWQLPICFPYGNAKCSILYAFSQSHRDRTDFCVCSLTICKTHMCFPRGYMQGASHTGRGCVCMRSMEHWGWLWTSWGDPQVRHPQQLVGGLRDGISGSVSRICVLLMPSKNPGCCSASPSLLSKHAAHFSILDGVRKKWAS